MRPRRSLESLDPEEMREQRPTASVDQAMFGKVKRRRERRPYVSWKS